MNLDNAGTTLLEHLRRCLKELMEKAQRTQEEEAEALALREQIQRIEAT